MKNNNIIKFFLFFICISIITGCSNGSSDHIDADDTGLGKMVKLKVKPDANSSNDVIQSTDGDGNCTAKWVDTGLFLTGKTYDEDGNDIPPQIGLSVSGLWYPWGIKRSGVAQECTMTTCGASGDDRCQYLDDATLIAKPFISNSNCYFTNAEGVYVLIAKQASDGSYPDPNKSFDVASGPSGSSGFYTAHIGEFPVTSKGLISVNKFWSCTKNPDTQKFVCDTIDINELVGGKIYLKLLDSYYVDNDSSIVNADKNPYIGINIKTGIFYPNFVSSTLKAFCNTIELVSYGMQSVIIDSLKDVIFVAVILYFCFTAFGFLTGLVKFNQTEAIVRLLKVGIVIMIISPNNIITLGFVHLYQNLADFASTVIADNLPYMPNISSYDNSAGNDFGNQIGYLSVYDIMFNQIISKQIHTKIWALLLTTNFWFIPLLYILIIIIIFVVFRSLLMYIVAYIQLSVGILILPILAVMLLFKVTAELFQNWLKYMLGSTLLIIVGTMGVGLTLSLMDKNLSDLLNYSVTWRHWFWFLDWWFPDNEDAVSDAISISTYLFSLISALICKTFIEGLPKLVDSLSDAQLANSQHAFQSLWNGIGNPLSPLNSLKSLNSFPIINRITKPALQLLLSPTEALRKFNARYLTGALLNRRYNKDGSDEGKAMLDKWKNTRDRADLLYQKAVKNPIRYGKDIIDPKSIVSSTKNLKESTLQKELSILEKENKYNDISADKYLKQIAAKESDLFKVMATPPNGGEPQAASLIGNEYKFGDGRVLGSKDDIENAIKGNGDLNGHSIKYRFEGDARAKLEKEVHGLGEVKKELEKIKRN